MWLLCYIKNTSYGPRIDYPILSNLRQNKGIQMKAFRPRYDRICNKRFFVGLKLSIAENLSQPIAALTRKRNVT